MANISGFVFDAFGESFCSSIESMFIFCGHCQDMLPLGPVLMDFDGLRGPL